MSGVRWTSRLYSRVTGSVTRRAAATTPGDAMPRVVQRRCRMPVNAIPARMTLPPRDDWWPRMKREMARRSGAREQDRRAPGEGWVSRCWECVADVLPQAQFRPQRPINTLLFLSVLWCHPLSLPGVTVSFLSGLQAHHDPGVWHASHHNGLWPVAIERQQSSRPGQSRLQQ